MTEMIEPPYEANVRFFIKSGSPYRTGCGVVTGEIVEVKGINFDGSFVEFPEPFRSKPVSCSKFFCGIGCCINSYRKNKAIKGAKQEIFKKIKGYFRDKFPDTSNDFQIKEVSSSSSQTRRISINPMPRCLPHSSELQRNLPNCEATGMLKPS